MSLRKPAVLIVDDEQSLVTAIVEGHARKPESYDIFAAGDGVEAIDHIQNSPIDLVVTDLNMPRLDGFGLISWLMTNRPLVPVLVMTSLATPEMEAQVMDAGALGILEKPISRDKLRTAIKAKLQQPVEARMSGVSLTSVLQLLALENKTCVLNTPGGRISMLDGKIVDARAGNATGIQAAVALVMAGGTSFTLGNLPSSTTPTMTLVVDHLLLDVARRMDEGISHDEDELAITEELLDEEFFTAMEEQIGGNGHGFNKANIQRSLEKAARIDGAIAVALVDFQSGTTMGTLGGGDAFDIGTAASFNTEVVRNKSKTIASLGLTDRIEDILITLSSQYHLIRTLERHPNMFLYLALDRQQANLGFARIKLQEVEQELEV